MNYFEYFCNKYTAALIINYTLYGHLLKLPHFNNYT